MGSAGAPVGHGFHSTERATLVFLLDVYSKCLLDIENHPIDLTQEQFDAFSREIVSGKPDLDEPLVQLRKYFSGYRVTEQAYVLKSFEEFKNLVWSFVERMTEDIRFDQSESGEIKSNLNQLKLAVQSESLQVLREKSRAFIDVYAKHQASQGARRSENLEVVKGQLEVIKRRLMEADRNSRVDHLTQAYNRRSFDETIRRQTSWAHLHQQPAALLIMDIDFFKRVNDAHGHDIGDFILKEFARLSRETFKGRHDHFSRIGGEEFAVLLPGHTDAMAMKRADSIMARVRREVFVVNDTELRFTISIGAAQLQDGETHEQWFKRADQALYESKNSGRDRCTLAQPSTSQLRSA